MNDLQRLKDALIAILWKTGGSCESYTTGVGSCYRNGRKLTSTSDQPCDSCIAHRALFGIESLS